MYIKLHGGACCGIKHIHDMGGSPDTKLSARDALIDGATSFNRHPVRGVNDAHADTYPEDFFYEEAPAETGAKRLDRLLKFLKKRRPHGIVEIVLTNSQHLWFPVLEDHGFVKVTTAVNSNTDNTLNVFHLSY
jgi:hypothetical protein